MAEFRTLEIFYPQVIRCTPDTEALERYCYYQQRSSVGSFLVMDIHLISRVGR